MNIFSHNSSLNTLDENAAVAELLLCFDNKNIYTRDINNVLVPIGNTVEYLYQLEDVKIANQTNQFVLKFVKTLSNTYNLEAVPLDIYFRNLSGTDFSASSQTYIGVTSSGLIGPIPDPAIALADLDEIRIDSRLNKYVLTFDESTFTFQLKPNNTFLETEDDVNLFENISKPFDIVRTLTTTEQRQYRGLYMIDRFSIGYDFSPALASHLNCQSNSLYNLQYATQSYNVDTEVASIVLDYRLNNVCIINGVNTLRRLSLTFFLPSSEIQFKPCALILNNFDGVLEINSQRETVFENGFLQLTGKNSSLILNIFPSIIQVIVKSQNLLPYDLLQTY